MNERILELANKANENIGYTFKLEDAKQIHELMEKFAELILTEVISTIYRSDISDKKQEKLVDELAYKFGMK